MWPSGEQELLLQAALLDGEPAVRAWHAWLGAARSAELDPATRELLLLAGSNLRRLGVGDRWRAALESWRDVAADRNRRALSLLGRILPALQAAGIEAIVFKGAALVPLYYESGARTIGDLDVLVPPGRFREATRILEAAGWTSNYFDPQRFDDRFEHAIAFVDSNRESVDLHCHLLIAACGPGADDRFWEAAEPVEIAGLRTRTLCPTDHLLHACVHGMTWGKRPSLRWAADAVTILRRAGERIDGDRLVGSARDLGLVLPVSAALAYVGARLGAPLPPGVLERLERSPVTRSERRQFRIMASPARGHPWTILGHHWAMLGRGVGRGGGPFARLRALPAYLRFWAQTDRSWKVVPGLTAKALHVIGYRLGLYRYHEPGQNRGRPPAPAYATGSRLRDLILFLVLAGVVVAGSSRLRAYSEVTVVDVSVARVAPDGTRHAIPTPEPFLRAGWAARPPNVLSGVERRIRRYVSERPGLAGGEEGRLEWTIRYSYNSTALDERRVIVVAPPRGR